MSGHKIILTGGAGYIGSHVCVELLEKGDTVLVIDDFSNSHPKSLERVRTITGINDPSRLQVIEADMANPDHNQRIIDKGVEFGPHGAVHMAGLKAVGESVAQPARYYRVNINATHTLLEAMSSAMDAGTGQGNIVFSSSATLYGDHNKSPVDESGKTGPTNPYGQTKFMIEQILEDVAHSDERWKICNLRYFNPVGAHPTGLIGEDPNDIPNNLFPFIAQVAVGRRAKLSVYGDDYETVDGTGVRDYIHVTDLANGHLKALEYLILHDAPATSRFNLGTGNGSSVLEVVAAFGKAAERDIPYQITNRRAGDIAAIYADATKAQEILKWETQKTLEDMCNDHWRWQSENPAGYAD